MEPGAFDRRRRHSHRRIVHVSDATAGRCSKRGKRRPAPSNITLIPHMVAVDLITGRHAEDFTTSGAVHGLYAFNRAKDRVETLTARATILATGGAGRTYLYSTAPRGATGDGIAMAWRAGCRISNMEFMQFHPTCFTIWRQEFPDHRGGARRGGILTIPKPASLHGRLDDRGDCSARRGGARSIMRSSGTADYVTSTSAPRPDFVGAFPTSTRIARTGIDSRGADPGVPAQHYTSRGDGRSRRRTDAPGFMPLARYSSGCRAQPLASNSLLECWFSEARRGNRGDWDELPAPPVRAWTKAGADSDEEVVIQQCWGEIRRFMGFRRHRPHHQAAGPRKPASTCCAMKSPIITSISASHPSDRAAQSGRGRRPDRSLSAVSPREPRAALYPGLSGACGSGD